MNGETAPAAARPHVTLHFAQSLDGRIATRSGAARWISGPEATRFAHELRAEADAVLVGSGTAMADDPLLTVRLVRGRQPLRVVLDGRGRLPREAKVLTDPSAPTLVVQRAGVPELARPELAPAHVERVVLPGSDEEGVDIRALLRCLSGRGIRTVVVEGGSSVITSFLRAGAVDRIVVTVAPIILGAGIDAVGDLRTERIDQAIRFDTKRVWRLGSDVLIELEIQEALVDRTAPESAREHP